VISKYIPINQEDIKVALEKQGNYEVLEVNIVLPETR
jgi:cell division topological specificity factor